jgi:hypothetical protein
VEKDSPGDGELFSIFQKILSQEKAEDFNYSHGVQLVSSNAPNRSLHGMEVAVPRGRLSVGQETRTQKEVVTMKRLMVLMVAAVFIFSGMAFAADVAKDKAGAAVTDKGGKDVQTKSPKAAPPKVAKMSFSGKVLDISDKALKVERVVKEKPETMDFVLEKAVEGVKAGDKVTVTYVVKDGKNVAQKVAKVKEAKKSEPGPALKDKGGKPVVDKSGKEVDTKKK